MTENLPEKIKPSIRVVQGGGLMPENFEGLWRLSSIMADSGLMPKGLQRPEAVFVAVEMGLEIGLSPMAAVQNIAVINGRPSIWGDSAIGVCQASGKMEKFFEDSTGDFEKGNYEATCTVKRKGDEKETVRKFTQAMAKRAGLLGKEGPWRQYPERMMQMRARSWALRDRFADVLKGLRLAEEERDSVIDVSQNKNGVYIASMDDDKAPTVVEDALKEQDLSLYTAEAQEPNQDDEPAPGVTQEEKDEITEPTPPPVESPWNPAEAELQQRYDGAKKRRLVIVAEKHGIAIGGMKPSEIHQAILNVTAEPTKAGDDPVTYTASPATALDPDNPRDQLIDKVLRLQARDRKRFEDVRTDLGVLAANPHGMSLGELEMIIKAYDDEGPF